MDINAFRRANPQYNDMTDGELSNSLREKYYSDIPKEEFESTFLIETSNLPIKKLLLKKLLKKKNMIPPLYENMQRTQS